MESYLKFLEEKVDRIIRDMSSVHILKKEIKNMKEENEVIKTLIFGLPTPVSLCSDINSKGAKGKKTEEDYSWYTKAHIHKEVNETGCILKRLNQLSRSQVETDVFSKEVDVALENIQQRITTHLLIKPKEEKLNSMTKLKLNKEVTEVNFADPKRQIKHLYRIIKKQGSEIAQDIDKIEKFTKWLQDNISLNTNKLEALDEKVKLYEEDMTRPSKFLTVESIPTFRDQQENIAPNLTWITSRYSTNRCEYPRVDRADLLIMWNKIKEDVKRSIDDSLKSQKKGKNRRYNSQQPTKRESNKEIQNSIERYRQGCVDTTKNSPIQSVKHLPQKRIGSIRVSNNKGSEIKSKTKTITTLSPWSTIFGNDELRLKSQYMKTSARTKQKTKNKQALSKLDKIYKELQTLEKDFSVANSSL